MLNNVIRAFSEFVFDKYYATDFLCNVTKDDWKFEETHQTSVLFGFNPETLHDTSLDDESEQVLFRFIWNRFDHILYVNMERFLPSDQLLFSSIYQDLLTFLHDKDIDCFVTVFSYDHISDIPDMMQLIPLSYTGSKSEKFLQILTCFPTILNGIPVLHINFDGIQFNDWNSNQFRLILDFDAPHVRIVSSSGEILDTLSTEKNAEQFVHELVY